MLSSAKRQKPPRTALQTAMREVAGRLTYVAMAASVLGALVSGPLETIEAIIVRHLLRWWLSVVHGP